MDIRNLRKVVEEWSATEIEKDRSDRYVGDRKKVLSSIEQAMQSSISELKAICDRIGLKNQVTPSMLDVILPQLRSEGDEKAYGDVLDRQRTLGSIKRQITSAEQQSAQPILRAEADAAAARRAFAEW